MRVRVWSTGAALVFLGAFSIGTLQAQEPPKRLRGTIERIDGNRMAVKARDGTDITVLLKEGAPVLAVVSASLADIKPGTYVGITGMPKSDGSQRAVEVHIFPEALRGTGDGHRPWDLVPDSTMTNGNIEEQVAGVDGQTLKLKYKDGEQKIEILPQTQVVAFEKATAADLKAGEKIFVAAATKLPDGTYEAQRIAVGKNGLTPPM
jgi:Domain of unknown function (DUF5666)